jgi:hypothetical protein
MLSMFSVAMPSSDDALTRLAAVAQAEASRHRGDIQVEAIAVEK